MNAPSVDIKDMLVADSSLGLIFSQVGGGNIFVGREPDSPADCVTVFDPPGTPPDLSLNPSEEYFRPSVQIRIRSKNYTEGYARGLAIIRSLHGRHGETVNGTFYSLIACSSDLGFLDWDVNNNARFVVNLNIQRR